MNALNAGRITPEQFVDLNEKIGGLDIDGNYKRSAPSQTSRGSSGCISMVAGGPNTDDVLKCQLKPLNRADYSVTFTDAQWARIQQTFPSGVCDFSKIGVGQQPPIAPRLTFSSGPGGTPLSPPPTSH